MHAGSKWGFLVSQRVSARSRRVSHPKSAITKQRILDAAARAFSLNGYAGTTINDIAMTAGMQGGSIYYYFESKDDILQEVLDVGITRVFSAARLAIGYDAFAARRLYIGEHTRVRAGAPGCETPESEASYRLWRILGAASFRRTALRRDSQECGPDHSAFDASRFNELGGYMVSIRPYAYSRASSEHGILH
ncbi:MAG: hypothetical protein B7Y57_07420 [Rhodospirillales bacterium 35-66-84]|nr:MAG: hypothetical protein B7Y57_07420 [Rhodospirillales bacterium 35-66-84]